MARLPLEDAADDHGGRLPDGESFRNVVYRPYLIREFSRAEARETVAQGLERARGSYERLPHFGIADTDYLNFMDFLRHQKLKPEQ